MSEEENKLNDLMISIGDSNYIDAAQTRDLFNLNNIIYPDLKEHGTGCSSCRIRVYNRLKAHWLSINKKEN
jgi:hypothetical protein